MFCLSKQKFVLFHYVPGNCTYKRKQKMRNSKLRERNESCDLLMSRDALGGWHMNNNAFCISGLINPQLLLLLVVVLKRIWRASLI